MRKSFIVSTFLSFLFTSFSIANTCNVSIARNFKKPTPAPIIGINTFNTEGLVNTEKLDIFGREYLNKDIFSSRNVFMIGQNFVVYKDTVVVQRLVNLRTEEEVLAYRDLLKMTKEEYQRKVEEASKRGEPPPPPPPDPPNGLDQSDYIYAKPQDGCYFLENGFIFCCFNGKITKIVQKPDPNAKFYDYFFGPYGECNQTCRGLLFKAMYNLFYVQRVLKFHRYQMGMSPVLYPDIITMIIIAKDDLLEPDLITLLAEKQHLQAKFGTKHNFDVPLVAFLFSSQGIVTRVPYSDFQMYNPIISQKYAMLVPNRLLLGPWDKDKDFDHDLFLKINGLDVMYYNRYNLPFEQLKVVSQNDTEDSIKTEFSKNQQILLKNKDIKAKHDAFLAKIKEEEEMKKSGVAAMYDPGFKVIIGEDGKTSGYEKFDREAYNRQISKEEKNATLLTPKNNQQAKTNNIDELQNLVDKATGKVKDAINSVTSAAANVAASKTKNTKLPSEQNKPNSRNTQHNDTKMTKKKV